MPSIQHGYPPLRPFDYDDGLPEQQSPPPIIFKHKVWSHGQGYLALPHESIPRNTQQYILPHRVGLTSDSAYEMMLPTYIGVSDPRCLWITRYRPGQIDVSPSISVTHLDLGNSYSMSGCSSVPHVKACLLTLKLSISTHTRVGACFRRGFDVVASRRRS
ncbi:hypothetical protein BDN71DRAFT_1451890 [Pleurotus eryngii]|uniref:Uncharacterized protein n=1 Tax=Pleurotus eryngii TaxID=5323 RepID=A0A9P5ZR89_PLEER|nr:hypothetical protein BDN71DRAFT_1451890 [Pleurotus eryngii]